MSAKVLSNLESVGDLIGSYMGMSDAIEEDEYVEGLIKQAHGHAANAFNVAAASAATAGIMTHVYEFGTAGITRGRVVFPDPVQEEARLWIHTIHGRGGHQDIGYAFRPATQPNPFPTTAETGVPNKYLQKLSRRKYIFWNKAFVSETGQSVTIKPKNGALLFVPFGPNGPRADDATTAMKNKNFMMYRGSITNTPGATQKGTFTSFWMKWWASMGQELLEEDMRKSVSMDIALAEKQIQKTASSETLKPVQTTSVRGAVAKARAGMKKFFTSHGRNVTPVR